MSDVTTPDETLTLCNRTASRLSIRTSGGRMVIPPLGSAEVNNSQIDRAELAPAEGAGVLRIEFPERRQEPASGSAVAAVAVIPALAWAAVTQRLGMVGVIIVAVVALAVAGSLVLSTLKAKGRIKRVRDVLVRGLARLRELAYLVGVLGIVIGVPGLILFFGSDVAELWRLASTDPVTPQDEVLAHQATVTLIGIGMQELCVVGASALPVLLYFLFDRQKLGTLRNTFLRHVFRLDPSVRTLSDVETRYGQLIDEAYGRKSENRLLPGTRWPILLATAVITIGWTVAMLDPNAAAQPAAGVSSLASLLTPQPNAATYAFLGAYFFALTSVVRGYVRGDLRPKTYAQVAARMVLVGVLAFVLEQIFRGFGATGPTEGLLVLAFIAGVVPETVLVRLQEISRTLTQTAQGRRTVDHLTRTYESEPLTQLEGIDIYDRARLLEEGVTNVEALAHHNLVELLLKTRIPAPRIVDWVDQAILYIHCSSDEEGEAAAPGTRPSVLRSLRRHGIRTATDLEHAHKQSKRRDNEPEFFALAGYRKGQLPKLLTILDALSDEEWMPGLRCWRRINKPLHVYRLPEDCLEDSFDSTPVSSTPAPAPQPSKQRPAKRRAKRPAKTKSTLDAVPDANASFTAPAASADTTASSATAEV